MRKLSALLIVMALLLPTATVKAAPGNVQYIGGTTYVPSQIETAVIDALANGNLDYSLFYAITDYSDKGNFEYYVSVVGLNTSAADWNMSNGVWIGLVYVWFQDGALHGDLMEEDKRGDMVADRGADVHILGGEVVPKAAYSFDMLMTPEQQKEVNVGVYNFPWLGQHSMKYGVLGVHDAGITSLPGWIAIDFVGTTNSPPEDADMTEVVRAISNGQVKWVCRDAYSMMLQVDFVVYAHLTLSGYEAGSHISEGEGFATLVHGTFDGNCGYATQDNDTWHLHLAVQPSAIVYFEDCSLWTPVQNSPFICGEGEDEVTYDVGDWILSTKQDVPETGIVPYPPETFWDWIVGGFVYVVNGVMDAIFPATDDTTNISVYVVQMALTYMRIVWTLFIANFDVTVILILIGIGTLMEAIRMLASLYRFVMKLIPFPK